MIINDFVQLSLKDISSSKIIVTEGSQADTYSLRICTRDAVILAKLNEKKVNNSPNLRICSSCCRTVKRIYASKVYPTNELCPKCLAKRLKHSGTNNYITKVILTKINEGNNGENIQNTHTTN